jgi:hypothetical protein
MRQNSFEACLPRTLEQNRGRLFLNVPGKILDVHDSLKLPTWQSSDKRDARAPGVANGVAYWWATPICSRRSKSLAPIDQFHGIPLGCAMPQLEIQR